MQLHPIDKPIYKRRYKTVVIGLIASLALLSLAFSTALISLYGNPEAGSNTLLNAAGVLLALTVVAAVINGLKDKPGMEEVVYVWRLKQELTRINRHINKIKAAAEQGDVNAMVILNYCYAGSEQVWELEDNTLVMEELHSWKADLAQLQNRYNVEVKPEGYSRALLEDY